MNNKSNNYLTGLIELGMSEREAKVYLAMLNKREASLSDLQKLSGVRSNKISEVVSSLVRNGYCTEKRVGNRRIIDALDPGSTLKPVLEELEDRLEQGNTLRKSLGKLYDDAEEVKEPYEYIEVVHGNANIHNKFNQLQKEAEFEILGFTRPPFAYFTPEMQKEQFIATEKFMQKGGVARSVVEANEESPARIFKTIEAGMTMMKDVDNSDKSELRVVAKLPIKMFIFDRKTLLITEKSSSIDQTELSMTVVKQNSMVEGYIALFDFFWEQGLQSDEWAESNAELFKNKLSEISNN